MDKRSRIILILASIVCLWIGQPVLCAQQTKNPFDLAPGLTPDTTAQKKETPLETKGANPFELVMDPTQDRAENPVEITEGSDNPFELRNMNTPDSMVEEPAQQLVGQKGLSRGWMFGIVLGLLVFFAVLMNFYRAELYISIRALLQDGAFTQLFRERETRDNLPFRLFFVFFLLNGALFLYHAIGIWEIRAQNLGWWWLGLLVFLVFAHYMAKRALLRWVRLLFPGKRGINLYHFTIILFGTAMGLVLFLFNLLILFLPSTTWFWLLVAVGIGGSFLLILRVLRTLVIVNQYFLGRFFHFLLYICTVEIAPVLVVVKLIQFFLAPSIGTF